MDYSYFSSLIKVIGFSDATFVPKSHNSCIKLYERKFGAKVHPSYDTNKQEIANVARYKTFVLSDVVARYTFFDYRFSTRASYPFARVF